MVNELRNVCELPNNERIWAAAVEKNDEDLLRLLRDQDMVAIEVRYHRSCYQNYVSNDTHVLKGTGEKSEKLYKWWNSRPYALFVQRMIVEKIVRKGKAYRLSYLTEVLNETIINKEIKTCVLKEILQRCFPQLVFLQQDYRTQSPLLLYEGSVSDFVCPENELDVPNESLFLSDDDASDSETECHTLLLKDPHVLKQYDCRAAYHVCMQLRSCVEEAAENPLAKISNLWPPEAKHLTVENVRRIVPVNLFNCIAWIVGATADYSTDDNFLDVNDDEHGPSQNVSWKA